MNKLGRLADNHGASSRRSLVDEVAHIIAGVGVGRQTDRTEALSCRIGTPRVKLAARGALLQRDSVVGQLSRAPLKLNLNNRAILTDGDFHRKRLARNGVCRCNRRRTVACPRSFTGSFSGSFSELLIDAEADRQLGSVVGLDAVHIGDSEASIDRAGLRKVEDREPDRLGDGAKTVLNGFPASILAAPVAIAHVRTEPNHGVARRIVLGVQERFFHQVWDVARGRPSLPWSGAEPLGDGVVLLGLIGQRIDLYDALDTEGLKRLGELIDSLLKLRGVRAHRGFFHACRTV